MSSQFKATFRALTVSISVVLGMMPLSAQVVCFPVEEFQWGNNMHRTSFNNVQAAGGTQIMGPFWFNWDTSVQATSRRDGIFLNSGSDEVEGGTSIVLWNHSPSILGTGNYTLSTSHVATCGGSTPLTENRQQSTTVQQPTITGLPNNNALWYFGPGTPAAVPTGLGTAHQSANLVFNTNCGPCPDPQDPCDCSGTPIWSTIGASGTVSVTAGGLLKSTGPGNCLHNWGVVANLGGWTFTEPIAVNSPKFLWHPRAEETIPYGSGFLTKVFWAVADQCAPAQSVPSVAFHEEFGTFSNPGVVQGWPDPPATWASSFNDSTFIFFDSIGAAQGATTFNPVPTFTSSAPPYSFFTLIKSTSQKWFMGSTSVGSGQQVFSGTIRWYQDHGNSQ